jgi:hypothetical protein
MAMNRALVLGRDDLLEPEMNTHEPGYFACQAGDDRLEADDTLADLLHDLLDVPEHAAVPPSVLTIRPV